MKPEVLSPGVAAGLHRVNGSSGTSLSRFPDFLIAGPQRTGSTWIFRHLDVHPEVFLPHGKETYYFSTLGRPEADHYRFNTLEAYLDFMRDTPWRHFRKMSRCLALCRQPYHPHLIGDATASYAILPPEVIRDIVALNPAIRVVIILRDPMERAWSHAKKDLLDREGKAPGEVDLEAYTRFFRARGQREKNRYSAILENWREALPADQLLAAEFRLIREAPRVLMHEILRFLGTEQKEEVISARRLERQINPTRSQPLPPAVSEWLEQEYTDLVRDYTDTLKRLAPHQVVDGCYRL